MEYQKLDPEFKAKWTAALRSGEYKQCFIGRLNCDEEYCCLGVAAELCGYRFNDPSENREPYTEVLPAAINGGFGNNAVSALVRLNDDHQIPFPAIADWIDANL